MQGCVITESDYKRLLQLLHGWIQRRPHEEHQLLNVYGELKEARVVRPEDVPPDVVTMRSIVLLVNEETGRKREVQLAYPAEANPASGKISVLTPLGVALIGKRIGGIVEDHDQNGRQQWRVESLQYQPEAAGRFDL